MLLPLLQEKSGVALVAHEKFAEPREVEVSLSLYMYVHRYVSVCLAESVYAVLSI